MICAPGRKGGQARPYDDFQRKRQVLPGPVMSLVHDSAERRMIDYCRGKRCRAATERLRYLLLQAFFLWSWPQWSHHALDRQVTSFRLRIPGHRIVKRSPRARPPLVHSRIVWRQMTDTLRCSSIRPIYTAISKSADARFILLEV